MTRTIAEAVAKFQVKLQDYGLAEWAHEEYVNRRREAVKVAVRDVAVAVINACPAALGNRLDFEAEIERLLGSGKGEDHDAG